jgi:hypothetical protein
MPLGFTDEELSSITAMASALPPPTRSDFLRLLAGMLAAHPPGARGPGLVHRLAFEARSDFLKSGHLR